MTELHRSDSKGEINDLLNDIKAIVKGNTETLDGLKAIKQKNDQIAKTKKRVDIPSVVSGHRKSEINIPHHKRGRPRETRSEINKSSNPNATDAPKTEEDNIPVVDVGSVGPVNSAPPPAPPRDQSGDRRRDRRDRSMERRKRIEAIRQKREAAPEPKSDPPVRSTRPSSSPARTRRSRPSRNGSNEPEAPVVDVGVGPSVFAPAPPRPRDTPTRRLSNGSPKLSVRGRTPSGRSENGGHFYRIRKDSEGSVEIFPDYIEEQKVVSEFKTPSIYSSFEELTLEDVPRPGTSPGRSLPRYPANTANSSWLGLSGNQQSLKKRIVLEKCPHCDDTDSPPEIEIRICRRSGRCGRSQDDLHIVPETSLMVEALPAPPARASSLHRIPTHTQDRDLSPPADLKRVTSPSMKEMERLARRLAELKHEVNSAARECEMDNFPINISVTDRPKSPYHPDKGPYYRARYHSAPQTPPPPGQDDKTTSTTDFGRCYHPAREEAETYKPGPESYKPGPVLHLSTQSLELPECDGGSLAEELEVQSITGGMVPDLKQAQFVPVTSGQPQNYDTELYDPECDLDSTTPGSEAVPPKREEQLLTPPPLPPRDSKSDITLRADNLFDPYHIGTTYVVLSRQNHGRFSFQSPADPNHSAPGTPRIPSSPAPGTPRIPSSPVPVIRQLAREPTSSPVPVMRPAPSPVPVIVPVTSVPVSATPPTSRRPLYVPKSVNGSVLSLTPRTETPPVSHPPVRADPPPPLPSRNSAKHMTPDQRRGFPRPVKEPTFRELAVDAPDMPVLQDRKQPSSVGSDNKNLASRDYHLQTILALDRPPEKLDTWSGAPPPASPTGGPRPSSPCSQDSLRRTMPHVRLLAGEWKELAQRLGYDNSEIAAFSRDYPDPGQALLDHWSRQPASRLDDLLQELKEMDLWKTADRLDKTFDNTNV